MNMEYLAGTSEALMGCVVLDQGFREGNGFGKSLVQAVVRLGLCDAGSSSLAPATPLPEEVLASRRSRPNLLKHIDTRTPQKFWSIPDLKAPRHDAGNGP
jgi:hypothetical protein